MERIISEFGVNIIIFIGTVFISFIAAYLYRKNELEKRSRYLLDTYKKNDEIKFICKDFDFFDHDQSYNKGLIQMDISKDIITYDFYKNVKENIQQGHFRKIAAFIKEFYHQTVPNYTAFIEESVKEIDLSKQYNYIQYGIKDICRSRKDLNGRSELSALYMTLQKFDPHTALLIDSIHRRLRAIDEAPLRLKSRELKFSVDRLERINDLNRLLIFLTTVKHTGLVIKKEYRNAVPAIVFKSNKNRDFAYTYDFLLSDQDTLDYEIDILNHTKEELKFLDNEAEKDLCIHITDVCFNYTEGFHLKLLSYLGYIDKKEVTDKNLTTINIEYTELESHLKNKCSDIELMLYALSLSKKAFNNIPSFLNNLNKHTYDTD